MHVFAGLAAAAAGALLTLGGCTTADGTHHHGPRQTMRDSAMPPADTRERPYDAPSHDMNRPHDRSRMPTAAHPGCADRQAETADRRRARRAAGTTASDEAHERHSAPGPRCWPGSVAYASEQARPSGRLQSCPAGFDLGKALEALVCLVPRERIELSTSPLPRVRSTTELPRHVLETGGF